MAHDEANPQSTERDPIQPARGLDNASSSPAPVLPSETTAPTAVPRTGDVSPPADAMPAAEPLSPIPAEPGAAQPTAEATATPPAETSAAAPLDSPQDTSPAAAVVDGGELATAQTADTATTDYHSHEGYHDPHHDPHHDPYHDQYHHDEYHHDYHANDGGSGGGSGGSDAPAPADEPDPLHGPETEEGGGPVKSFLEHLEDMRWVIIKCVTSVAVAMVVCLLAVPQIVALMSWPLDRAAQLELAFLPTSSGKLVDVMAGDQRLWSFRLKGGEPAGLPLGTNKHVAFELITVTVGTNQVLALKPRADLPPLKPLPIVFQSPMEPFFSSLKIAFFGGFLLACPFVLFVIIDFVMPALRVKEKKYFLRAFWVSVALFIIGVTLCYFLLLPLGLKAAESYANWMGAEFLFWRAEDYFGFVVKFLLAMGLGFEMPVVLLALVKIGVLDYGKLAAFRRYMIVVNFVLAAMLAPEVVTQIIIFFPLQLLYELTIWAAWFMEQKDRGKARKRAVMVVGGILLLAELVWLFIQFGLPWLKAQS